MRLYFFLIFLVPVSAQVQVGPFAGAVTDSSAVFIIKTYSEQSARIEMFSGNDIKGTIYSDEILTDSADYCYGKIYIKDLQPNTTYYYRAAVDGIPSKRWHSFQTFPREKKYSFSFGFGSCQQNNWIPPDPEIFPVIANDTLRFFAQIGDWTYPDTTERKYGYRYYISRDLLEQSYRAKYNYNYPFSSEVLFKMPVVYTYDDHDFGFNNSDGSDSAKVNSLWAYKTFFPHYELKNPDNGIWQSFICGDVEFFLLDLRSQRNPGKAALDENGKLNPPPGHSILAGYDITGTDQKEWFLNALKNSTAKWKVIISSVIFNLSYAKGAEIDSLPEELSWLPDDVTDKWAGYPEDYNAVLNTVIANDIKNVLVISGDTHSSYIDDGKNSVFPEISASNLDVGNSRIDELLRSAGLNIWNKGSYNDDGHTYGRIRFFFEREDYALLEIVNEKGEVVISHRVNAR